MITLNPIGVKIAERNLVSAFLPTLKISNTANSNAFRWQKRLVGKPYERLHRKTVLVVESEKWQLYYVPKTKRWYQWNVATEGNVETLPFGVDARGLIAHGDEVLQPFIESYFIPAMCVPADAVSAVETYLSAA
jgi:hypothetical protein